MKKEFLLASAAAVLLTTGAMAQSQDVKPQTEMKGMEQRAPNNASDTGREHMKAAPGAMRHSETTGQAGSTKSEGAARSETMHNDKDKTRAGVSTQTEVTRDKNDATTKSNMTQSDQSGQMKTNRQTTTGQATGAGRANVAVQLSTQQRTQVRDVIIKAHPPKVEHVNFSLTVGTRVPRTEHLVRLPTRVVEIVPEYRDYLYFMVADQIVVVDPGTYEIVAVLTV